MTATGPDERSSVGQVRLQPCCLFCGRILSDKRRDRHAGPLERGRSLVCPPLQLGGRSIEEVLPIAEDDVLSRPATYLTWDLTSTDGASHDVSLYFDASSDLVVNTAEQPVT